MKIESYFSGIKNANEAVEKLKSSGFKKCFSDLNAHDIRENNISNNRAGTENTPSLSSLVLNSGNPIDDAGHGPLLAASPMVSGMGSFEEIADINYKVIVDADEKDTEKIKQIIKDMGGELANPNPQIPKGIENISWSDMEERLKD